MNCSYTSRDIQAKIPIFEKIVGDMGVTSVEIADGFALQRWHCKFTSPQSRASMRSSMCWVPGSSMHATFLNFQPHDARLV